MSTENSSAAPTESLRMTRQQGWLLLLALIALSAVLFALEADGAPAVEREVVVTTGFIPLARRPQVVMVYPPALSADTAVFVGSLNPDNDPQLTAIDLNSGELHWQVNGADQIRPDLWPDEVGWIWPFAWRWGPVILVDDQLIAADAFGLTTTVNAFDIHTGEPRWQHSIGMINGSDVSYLVPSIDDTIVARVAVEGYSDFQIIDPTTGLRQFRRQEDAGAIFWVDEEPRRVFEAFVNQIRVTGEQAWQQTVSGCNVLPLMADALVIVQTFPCPQEDNRGVPGLAALSRADGTIQWQISLPIVSNIALDGDRIIGLTVDTDLVVIEQATGQIIGTMPFAPALSFEGDANYFVAAHNGLIAVYFGDSLELVVVQFTTQQSQ